MLSWYTHTCECVCVCLPACVCLSSIFLKGKFTDLETVGGSAVTTVMDSLVDHLRLSTCLNCGNHGNWFQHYTDFIHYQGFTISHMLVVCACMCVFAMLSCCQC